MPTYKNKKDFVKYLSEEGRKLTLIAGFIDRVSANCVKCDTNLHLDYIHDYLSRFDLKDLQKLAKQDNCGVLCCKCYKDQSIKEQKNMNLEQIQRALGMEQIPPELREMLQALANNQEQQPNPALLTRVFQAAIQNFIRSQNNSPIAQALRTLMTSGSDTHAVSNANAHCVYQCKFIFPPHATVGYFASGSITTPNQDMQDLEIPQGEVLIIDSIYTDMQSITNPVVNILKNRSIFLATAPVNVYGCMMLAREDLHTRLGFMSNDILSVQAQATQPNNSDQNETVKLYLNAQYQAVDPTTQRSIANDLYGNAARRALGNF